MSTLRTSLMALFVVITGPSTVWADYRVTDLGDLSGGAGFSFGFGLNSSGAVVGSVDPPQHAFLYTTSMTDLGVLATGRTSRALAINASGQVAGYSDIDSGPRERRPFLYNGTTMLDLGTFGGNVGEAYGINDSGVVVGYSLNLSGVPRAFIYDGTGLRDIGTLGGGAAAYGINAAGKVVGFSGRRDGPLGAFLYDGTRMIDLGILGESVAVAINSADFVVGSYLTASERYRAFLYDGTSVMDIGALASGDDSFATSINDLGQVVGQSQSPATGRDRAFIYESGTMRDLNALLAPEFSGWRLLGASGINNAGQICGSGYNPNGWYHAFLLTPR